MSTALHKPLYVNLSIKHQLCFFNKPIYKHVIADQLPIILKYHQLHLHAWCLMSDRLLLIVSAQSKEKQTQFVNDFCHRTSQTCHRILKSFSKERSPWLSDFLKQIDLEDFNQNIWENEANTIVLENDAEIQSRIKEIHNKPVAAEYVITPKHYLYSSACNYHGIQGLIPVEILQHLVEKLS